RARLVRRALASAPFSLPAGGRVSRFWSAPHTDGRSPARVHGLAAHYLPVPAGSAGIDGSMAICILDECSRAEPGVLSRRLRRFQGVFFGLTMWTPNKNGVNLFPRGNRNVLTARRVSKGTSFGANLKCSEQYS